MGKTYIGTFKVGHYLEKPTLLLGKPLGKTHFSFGKNLFFVFLRLIILLELLDPYRTTNILSGLARPTLVCQFKIGKLILSMGPRISSDRRVLFLVCRAALVWSLVSLGGSRMDGVAIFCNTSIIVHRWRCPRFIL